MWICLWSKNLVFTRSLHCVLFFVWFMTISRHNYQYSIDMDQFVSIILFCFKYTKLVNSNDAGIFMKVTYWWSFIHASSYFLAPCCQVVYRWFLQRNLLHSPLPTSWLVENQDTSQQGGRVSEQFTFNAHVSVSVDETWCFLYSSDVRQLGCTRCFSTCSRTNMSKACGEALYQCVYNSFHVTGNLSSFIKSALVSLQSLTRTVPGIGVYFCSLHTIRSNFG